MPTILTLPPQQGGLVFGPFDGIVQLGSDATRVQITLDSRNGIYPIHATLALTSAGTHQFAPAEMGAKCFVVQQGSPQLWPVQGAVQVTHGDSIVLGTPAGPRFLLSAPQGVAPGAHAVGPSGPGLLDQLQGWMPGSQQRPSNLGQGVANEFLRRGQMQLFRNSSFRQLSYFRQRMRTGSLFNPVTIVSGLIALAGSLGAAVMTCLGVGASLLHQFGG